MASAKISNQHPLRCQLCAILPPQCNEFSILISLYANFSLFAYMFFFALFNGTIMMIVNHYGKPGALHLTAVNKITHDCYMIFTFASKRLKRDCKHDFDCDCDCDRNLIEIYLIESFDMIEYKKIFKKGSLKWSKASRQLSPVKCFQNGYRSYFVEQFYFGPSVRAIQAFVEPFFSRFSLSCLVLCCFFFVRLLFN